MAIISGVVRKGEDSVEGAKVYILYDGEVVASAETNVGGEYFCDGLDEDKKYHAVVEHEEVDDEEVTLYSARSVPGIVPAEDPRFFLYKDGVGEENWSVEEGVTIKQGYITLSPGEPDTGGGYLSGISTVITHDLTNINYIKVEYEGGNDGDCNNEIYTISPYKYFCFEMSYDRNVAVWDVSDVIGERTIRVSTSSDIYPYTSNSLIIFKVWLE